jgi:hypothetical protein
MLAQLEMSTPILPLLADLDVDTWFLYRCLLLVLDARDEVSFDHTCRTSTTAELTRSVEGF